MSEIPTFIEIDGEIIPNHASAGNKPYPPKREVAPESEHPEFEEVAGTAVRLISDDDRNKEIIEEARSKVAPLPGKKPHAPRSEAEKRRIATQRDEITHNAVRDPREQS